VLSAAQAKRALGSTSLGFPDPRRLPPAPIASAADADLVMQVSRPLVPEVTASCVAASPPSSCQATGNTMKGWQLPADTNSTLYKLQLILRIVVVDWTEEFGRWLDHAEEQGGRLLTIAVALLQALTDLSAKPAEEAATFKRVRQARRHELWRVAHPFDPEVAVRIICWFPADDQVVIALIGFDKKTMGDVFNAGAAARGEALVDAWLRQKGNSDDGRRQIHPRQRPHHPVGSAARPG
jgi:hypothetical protein